MLKITITSTDVRNMSGVAKASGKAYNMNFQTAWVHTYDRKSAKPNPYPEKIEIILEKDERDNPVVHAPGEYQLHPASIFVGDRGLEVAPKLVPLKA